MLRLLLLLVVLKDLGSSWVGKVRLVEQRLVVVVVVGLLQGRLAGHHDG